GDDVGLVAVRVGAEITSEPAEGADDLVGDEQHVVLVADLPHPLEVARRRWEAATRVLHGLEEDGRDGVWALELDGLGDTVRRPPAECLDVVPVLRRAVEVGVWYPERAWHQRLERRLELGQSGKGQRAGRRAVGG